MLYFIFGMLFCMLIQPVIGGITDVILAFIEYIKSKLSIPITKANSIVDKIINNEDVSNPIGFQISPEEEDI